MVEIIAPDPELPGRVGDVTRQDYLDWKHHPVTKVFRQYLADYIEKIRDDHTARWEQSESYDVALESEARGRVLAVNEIHTLPFEAICSFYQEDTEIDDAQIGEDIAG